MEPATQYSNVPYSLLDIQLPESPENIKPSKGTSDHESNLQSVDSQSMVDDNQSNGVVSTSTENNLNEKLPDKKSSNKVSNLKDLESHDNSSKGNKHADKDSFRTRHSKESNAGDSKNESISTSYRSQSKKSDSDHKHSLSKKDSNEQKGVGYMKDSRTRDHDRKTHKSREDSPVRRDSRSRSREKDRRARRSRKDSDSRKAVSDHRDSRSKSKESDCKSHKSKLDSKRYKTTRGRRKSRSRSTESGTDKNSESDEEYRKKKLKSKETKRKRRDKKRESDSGSDKKSRSRSLENSPQATHKRKTHSNRLKDKKHKSESSEDTRSSRSRSPVKRKPESKSDEPPTESVAAGRHSRRKERQRSENTEDKQVSRSKSRESSPTQKKSKSKQTEPSSHSDKQKEKSYKSSDEGQGSRSRSRESSPVGKTSKRKSNKPVTSPKSASEEEKEHRHKDSQSHMSRSKSKESSPIHKMSKSKFDELHSAESITKSARQKNKQRNKSSEDSRSRSPVTHESRSKLNKSPVDAENMSQHVGKDKNKSESLPNSPNSMNRSPENSPLLEKTGKELNKQLHDFIGSSRHSKHKEKDHGNENSEDDHTSKSKSSERALNQASKRNEPSGEVAASAEHRRHKSQSSNDDRDNSPVPKKSKNRSCELDIDLKMSDKALLRDVISIEKEEKRKHVATSKSSTISVVKEPADQKLKIEPDNVVSPLSQNKKDAMEKNELSKENQREKSNFSESAESVDEDKKEATKVPAPYVSRKITLSRRTLSQASDDEPKNKRSKWGSFASSQKTSQTINISTNSLKNWFPDFKLLKDPVSEESVSFSKDESDMEVSTNRVAEDPRPKKSEESRQDMLLDVPPEDMDSATKILFIQNLVRPFTLNQLKELLRETGNFVEENFWIDKIKSKCFVTYETEEAAMKTKHALNGTRWPSSNPKILSVEYSNEEELEFHRSGSDLSKPTQQPVPEPTESQDSRSAHVAYEHHKKDHDQDHKRDRSKHQLPIREWDKDKIIQDSPDRERSGRSRDVDKSKNLDKKERKDSKKRTNEDTPAKLLDDLFQKTKSSPCIYWLPLTDEQVQERTESRRLRRLEREKRNQQRDQEDTENKIKGPRSRNRTKEMETRRSSSRSRSPITRRR